MHFAQTFQTKTRNEWVMTSAMLDRSPSPCYSAISEWHNKNIETFSKEPMTVHGFKQFHLNSGGSFQKKNQSLLFLCFFACPLADVFKGTDACCVPVLNPSEAVGVLSC